MCASLAANAFNLALSSPSFRTALAVAGWGALAWNAWGRLHWAPRIVGIAVELIYEPRARSLLREGWRIDRENARQEDAFQRAFDANTAAIRTDPRPDARPGPPGEAEEDALVRNVIEACEDGECAVCATALTPQMLVMLDCCVPKQVHGAVGHALCRRCWARVPDLLEPKRCPHCRRVAKACAPAEMVRMIKGGV